MICPARGISSGDDLSQKLVHQHRQCLRSDLAPPIRSVRMLAPARAPVNMVLIILAPSSVEM